MSFRNRLVTGALIAPGAVTDRHIGDVSATKLTAGQIAAEAITLGPSSAAQIKSSNFVAGGAGWRIRGDGAAEFGTLVARGSMTVGGGTVALDGTGVKIDAFPHGAFHVPESQPRTLAWVHNGVAYSWLRGDDNGDFYVQSLATAAVNLQPNDGVVTINVVNKSMQTTANPSNLRWGTVDGNLYQVTSSGRWKRQLGLSTGQRQRFLDVFDRVPVRRYRSLHEADDDRPMLGFMAEEVHDLWPEAAYRDADGEIVAVDERQLLALTVLAVQQLRRERKAKQ